MQKIALVTGSYKGIGNGIAVSLEKEGYIVHMANLAHPPYAPYHKPYMFFCRNNSRPDHPYIGGE